MEYDLMKLEDSVFEIHEEKVTDEKDLFHLDKMFERIMLTNKKARVDGVVRVRLSPDLRKTATNWEDFFSKHIRQETEGTDIEAGNNHGSDAGILYAQFLYAPDIPAINLQAGSVMECHNVKLKKDDSPFYRRLPNLNEMLIPPENCCSQSLKEKGIRGLVKHFYDTLKTKSIFLKWTKPTAQDPCIARKKFNERQKIMEGSDPADVCALIEKSMMSRTYVAYPGPEEQVVQCKCYRCHLRSLSEASITSLEAVGVKDNGDGDNCSLYLTDIVQDAKKFLYVTPNFAMSHLCHANMLTDLECHWKGVSFPSLHVGGLHSYVSLRIENMSLPSFNFLHLGNFKLWIVVSPTEITKLSYLLSYYCISSVRVCIFKLSHKNVVITPQLLIHHKIKFKIIIQEPGDFILLAPNAAHTEGNLGLSLTEACNLGTSSWLPYGSVSSTENCICTSNKEIHKDITHLIKIHCKKLLKFHESGTMSENYDDEFFKSSIIRLSPSSGGSPQPCPPAVPDTVRKHNKKRKMISCSPPYQQKGTHESF